MFSFLSFSAQGFHNFSLFTLCIVYREKLFENIFILYFSCSYSWNYIIVSVTIELLFLFCYEVEINIDNPQLRVILVDN